MTFELNTGFLNGFFYDEHSKLNLRKTQHNSIGSVYDNSSQKSKQVNSVLTYGNVLYDFCLYRMKLKFFHKKRLWIRKIHKLLNLTYEVVRAITKDDNLPYIEEFYREYNYKKYQS